MARAATTSDPFNAIAEQRRREIFEFLCRAEQPVNAVVEALELDQPAVSKHLRVLKQVGLVNVRGNLVSPRVSLEDGAKFRGSIDMEADPKAAPNLGSGPSAPSNSKSAAAAPASGNSEPAASKPK